MFNEEVKRAFIKQYSSVLKKRNDCVFLFGFTASFEEALNKDVCTMTPDEISPIANELVGIKKGSNYRLYILRQYILWCIENNIPGAQNSLQGLSIQNIEKIKRLTVTGPKQLQVYLDALFDEESLETIDNVYRAFFWLAFAGIPFEHSLKLTVDQVHLSELSFVINGRNYPIYREALPCIKNCLELPYFMRRYKELNCYKKRNRIAGDLLFRGVKANPVRTTFISIIGAHQRQALSEKRTNKEISYSRARFSGIYYRMYEDELAGLPIDSETLLQEYLTDKPSADLTQQQKRRIIRDMIDDYEKWKLTF